MVIVSLVQADANIEKGSSPRSNSALEIMLTTRTLRFNTAFRVLVAMLVFNHTKRTATFAKHQPHIAYDAFRVLERRKMPAAFML